MRGVQQGETERQQKVATAKDLGVKFCNRGVGRHVKKEVGDLEGVTTRLKTQNRSSLSSRLVFCELCSYRGGGTVLMHMCNSKVRCMDGLVDERCKTRGITDGEQEGQTKVYQTVAPFFCLC